MTKEEILHKHLGYHWENVSLRSEYAAMDEYAKQVAIGFKFWLTNNIPLGSYSDEELYEFYLREINNN